MKAIKYNKQYIDNNDKKNVLNALAEEKITTGKTSIIIAHRLTTIRNAERKIVLENGEIVEQGPHEELIKVPGGHYANLYEMQLAKELSH